MLRDDYSGAFDPSFDLDHLTRRALAVLGREWMLHGHLQDRVGMPLVHAGRPSSEMAQVAIEEWMGVSPIYSRRMQRAFRFGNGDVPTIMKNLQLDIGAPHHFMDFRCHVEDATHGSFHLAHCGALMDVEPMGEDYVRQMCHDIEDPTFDATAVATNPRARVRPVHRPPRLPAGRTPHCEWTVEIVADAEPIQAHPNVALVEESRVAGIDVWVPERDAEPGGWPDYDREFDPDFQLEDLSHSALVVALQEFAVQSHLLFRGYLLSVTQRYGADEAARLRPQVFTGLAGLTAQRLRPALAIEGDGADAIAKVLQLHPTFFPRSYVRTAIEVVDPDRVRFAMLACPALDEADGLTWFADFGAAPHPALDAIVRAVNPRASCTPVATGRGEHWAWEAVIDPDATPAPEAPEIGLAKISTGASVTFTPAPPGARGVTDIQPVATLWQLVERRADASPDMVMAVDDGGRSLTFAEFADATLRVAAGLQAQGVASGTTVAWQLPTRFDAMMLTVALARLDAVQVPLLPVYREREVGFITAQVGAELLVVPDTWRGFDYNAFARGIAANLPGLEVLVADPGFPTDDPAVLAPYPDADPADLPVRFVYYTSGTTGVPKGVRHTDTGVLAAAYAMATRFGAGPDDRTAIVFPFSHIGGAVWLAAALMSGCRQLVVETFDPVATIDFLDREGLTLAGGGTIFCMQYLARARQVPDRKILTKVRAFLAGAAPKPPDLHDTLQREIGGDGLLSAYGMTECAVASCGSADDPEETMRSTEGRLSPGVEAIVVGPDGTPVSPGEIGELLITGPQLFHGYVDPTLDADAFDASGRYRTGDLGSVDAGGFVRITGRLKEVIIRKGENISAKEIEDLLHEHPQIADVAVIGLPDPETGERVCAIVVPADSGAALTFDEMVAYLRDQKLMAQKIPEQLEILDVLPRNATGKVLKHELRETLVRR